MDTDKHVSVRLPSAMVDDLQARADKEDRDLSKEIRRALKLYLARVGKK